MYNGDGEGEDHEENVYLTAAKEFPKGFVEYDSEAAIKENENCKGDTQRRNVMRPCPCNVAAPHNTKFGSVRFCKHFLDIDNLRGRLDHLKEISECFKCLQLNHRANACKARLKCPYCHQAGKNNTKHNAALCANLDDTEFANAVNRKPPENKQEPKQTVEESYVLDADFLDRPITVQGIVFPTYRKYM